MFFFDFYSTKQYIVYLYKYKFVTMQSNTFPITLSFQTSLQPSYPSLSHFFHQKNHVSRTQKNNNNFEQKSTSWFGSHNIPARSRGNNTDWLTLTLTNWIIKLYNGQTAILYKFSSSFFSALSASKTVIFLTLLQLFSGVHDGTYGTLYLLLRCCDPLGSGVCGVRATIKFKEKIISSSSATTRLETVETA